MPGETALYRHFGEDGRLLYVGISANAHKRTEDHERRSWWFREVSRIEIEWLGSREEALARERAVIQSEIPACNSTLARRARRIAQQCLRPRSCEEPVLPKDDAIRIAGSQRALAELLGVSRQAVSLWDEVVPRRLAARLREIDPRFSFPPEPVVEPPEVEIGDSIRAKLNRPGVNLTHLAERSGVSIRTLRRIKNGEANPLSVTISTIWQALRTMR